MCQGDNQNALQRVGPQLTGDRAELSKLIDQIAVLKDTQPESAALLRMYASLLGCAGRIPEAEANLRRALALTPDDAVREVEIAENVDASERVIHLDAAASDASRWSRALVSSAGDFTGITMAGPAGCRVLRGSPHVTDRLLVGKATAVDVRRHVLAFFQGNRFLLRHLVGHVIAQIPEASPVIDLYAGGGLFAVAAARVRHARVTAVEGDWAAADDLAANASSTDGGVVPVHQPVEVFVDPPRTGLSREALDGVVRLRAARLVYVSCDVATLARDARRLVDAGYAVTKADGFDLFPITPHVETVVVFDA